MKYLVFFSIFSLFLSKLSAVVGETSLGIEFGEASFEHKVLGRSDLDWEVDGTVWELGANFNIKDNANYGMDLALDFYYGEPDSDQVKASLSKFDFALRPFMKLNGVILFAELGFSRFHTEIDDEEFFSGRSVVPALGGQFSADKLTFSPSVDYVDYGLQAEGFIFNLPLHYSLNDNFDIFFRYSRTAFDDYTHDDFIYQENAYETFSIGFDLRFSK
jgi:hypothetical protein